MKKLTCIMKEIIIYTLGLFDNEEYILKNMNRHR